MEIGNGGMSSLQIPKYKGGAVKDKTHKQGQETDFC